MSTCNISIPFTGAPEIILDKAKKFIESQSGNINGDTLQGDFDLSVFGNAIIGSYTTENQNLHLVITDKPFMVPCSMIESMLKQKLS